jgi:hypothetical protein
MPLYEMTGDAFTEIKATSFAAEVVTERADLQRLLRTHIQIIAPDTKFIAEEFSAWEDSRRRIDLLALDRDARLVVVELKRTDTGGHSELQALRYAAMASSMKFDDVVRAHAHAEQISDEAARDAILEFLDWEEPDLAKFAQDVRIVLAAADFSKEITTTVLWLNRKIDIRCVRMARYRVGDKLLLNVEQVLPLKGSEEFQVRLRMKEEEQTAAIFSGRDYTKFDVTIGGATEERMSKRVAIFRVIQHLVRDREVSPEQIRELLPNRKGRLWRSAEGKLNSADLVRAAEAEAHLPGHSFDPNRYFLAEDELFHIGGRTYALTNQWGRSTEQSIRTLFSAFPEAGFSVKPSAE